MARLKDAGLNPVVPYIGTWIETKRGTTTRDIGNVVPYIGTWIETLWFLYYLP